MVNGTLTITPAPAPTITSILPDTGLTNGGTSVSIFGTGFQSGATVYFGAVAATSVTVSNATNLIATTPAVLAAGEVDVILTNADGQSADLTNGFTYTGPQVNFSAPQITGDVTNQSAAPGSNATFTVTASGSSPLTYQWLFNNTNVSGATNTTFTISNVQPAFAGPYFVIVTNPYGAATSSVATLSILGVPVSLASQPQYSGGQFVLQLSGLTGQGPIVIQSSSNFVDWTPIFTNPPGYGQLQFIDTNAGINAFNYYRAVTPAAP